MRSSWLRVGIPVLFVMLLFGSMLGSAGAVAKDDGIGKAKKIAKKIEKDLKETGKYSEKDLEKLILVLAEEHKLTLSEEEKKAAKDYVLHEIKKKIKLEKLKKNAISETTTKLEKIISENETTYKILSGEPIFTFKQIEDDITGTSGYYKFDDAGNPYNINGNNDLYRVDISTVYLDDPDYTNCPVGETYWMYTMYYYDEDHPNPDLDPLYDAIRQATYGRIEDIETFYVRTSDNMICFDEIWSNDKTFAEPVGQHGIAYFSSTSRIYVSVWNHALDVDDDNPSLDKVVKP
jgi:hypothetical protein